MDGVTDIVPELLEAIQQSFADFVAADADITALLEKVAAGTATHAETEEYALLIGEYAASALRINLTAETLPDGTLYYNIAERTIPPTLQQSYEMVTDVAAQVQQTLNEAAGIGIKPITAELDTERVEGIVNAAVSKNSIEEAQTVIEETVVNITQSFADDFVQVNADFQYQAGLSPKVTRKVVGGCCDWCRGKAGTYDYGKQPEGFFGRHKNCRCTVTYDPGDGSKQNVWTKKPVTSSEDTATIETRKTVGMESSQQRTFQSQQLLERHYERHSQEFGAISVPGYLERANNLANAPLSDDVVELLRSDNSTSRYCFSTNEFVVINEDGTIRTFFKPERREAYWQYELDRN
ncbi:MAG: hypothetical protein LUE22_00835 [Oscillospiraceae bacterium]|nr:hypothetical protein [Oscillospiraceae bacterium]